MTNQIRTRMPGTPSNQARMYFILFPSQNATAIGCPACCFSIRLSGRESQQLRSLLKQKPCGGNSTPAGCRGHGRRSAVDPKNLQTKPCRFCLYNGSESLLELV